MLPVNPVPSILYISIGRRSDFHKRSIKKYIDIFFTVRQKGFVGLRASNNLGEIRRLLAFVALRA